ALRGAVGGALTQVACIVDAAVARGVDLDDVDAAGAPTGERDARLALTARLRGWPLLAVEAPREDPGARRLAAATRTAEELGVVDPPRAQRLHQRLRHVL